MNTEIQTQAQTQTAIENRTEKRTLLGLLRNERGDFIQKLLLIGLFSLVVAAGVKFLGGKALDKINDQAGTIDGINSEIGAGGAKGGE